jgi:drug/metabolite transporter (DMT)-like permease
MRTFAVHNAKIMTHGNIAFHLLAILVVLVWGVTFVNSKVLLQHGMEAHEIFTVRFLLAYVCIWFLPQRRVLMAANWRDEALMLLLGFTGGSLYFLSENVAVKISYVNNVAFIVCTAPLITTALAILFLKDVKPTRRLIGGSLLALVGVALVIFNGRFILRLNPAGDLLALTAAVCWAVYSIVIKFVSGRYSAVFITRKVFFYGLLTVLPVFAVEPWQFPLRGLLQPAVGLNLLFLGVVASFACFALWSLAIKRVGAISVSNYVYLNPLTTVVASALFLNEPMTWMAYAGSAFILGGVYLANSQPAEG